MAALNCNGFVFQRKKESFYKGIDGDNWYLNYRSPDKYFADFYDNVIYAWEYEDRVGCCINDLYIRRYIQESAKLGIDFRLLLCFTEKSSPRRGMKNEEKAAFLGYDYAYSSGSYYSCILNDIIAERIKEFNDISLNENGLFSSYDEVLAFSKYREELKKTRPDYFFEEGDFVIYKILEMVDFI